MELEAGNSTAGAATAASHATHQHAVANNDATADQRPSDAGVAYPAVVATLDNELCFTLTVGQARAIFAERNRKVPADRTLQNYCVEGHVVAQKIRTTFGSEWLINEESLNKFIAAQPIIATATPATPAPLFTEKPLNMAPATTATSDAGGATVAIATPVGETRSLAQVLIENARLLATSEGKDNVIAEKIGQISELREDRSFLREEIREARRNRDDVKNIAERMLDTLKTMALGRLGMGEPERPEPRRSTFTDDRPNDRS